VLSEILGFEGGEFEDFGLQCETVQLVDMVPSLGLATEPLRLVLVLFVFANISFPCSRRRDYKMFLNFL
jgi:hypothetical protein